MGADPGAPQRSGESVLVYFKYGRQQNDPSWSQYRDETLVPAFRALQGGEYKAAEINFLAEDSRHGIRTFAGNLSRTWPVEAAVLGLTERRIPRPYGHAVLDPAIDLLVKIDLDGPLSRDQLRALRTIRSAMEDRGELSISKTTNYRNFTRRAPRETDVYMGFLNRWMPESKKSRRDQQEYWRERHGRKAVKLGMPRQLVTYSQLHTDLEQPADGVFDTKFQGMSFETIESRAALAKMSRNPRVLAMNAGLIRDEQHFTRDPPMLLFRKIDLKK